MSDVGFVHDPLEVADIALAELRDTTACRTCGSREPVRVGTVGGKAVCSDCWDGWRRCVNCRRWLDGDDQAISLTYVTAFGVGDLCHVCQDKHLHDEPRYLVTVGADDYIEDISDAD